MCWLINLAVSCLTFRVCFALFFTIPFRTPGVTGGGEVAEERAAFTHKALF